MLRNYLPVLLLLGFVILNAVVIIGVSHLTVRAQPTPVKSQPYESGVPDFDAFALFQCFTRARNPK